MRYQIEYDLSHLDGKESDEMICNGKIGHTVIVVVWMATTEISIWVLVTKFVSLLFVSSELSMIHWIISECFEALEPFCMAILRSFMIGSIRLKGWNHQLSIRVSRNHSQPSYLTWQSRLTLRHLKGTVAHFVSIVRSESSVN